MPRVGRVRRAVLACLLVLLGVPAAASAALSPCAGPTGTAAIDQYCEIIPGAGGPKPVAGHPIPHLAPGSTPRGSVTLASGPGSRPRPRTGSAGEKSPVRSHPARSHRRHASGGSATRGAGGPSAGTPGTSPGGGVIPATKSSIGQGEKYGGPLFWLLVASGVLAGLFALVRWRRRQRTSAPSR